MSLPTPIGHVLSELNPLDEARFPFFWWAICNRFAFPEEARHLFARTGSGAEAFFLGAVVRSGPMELLGDRVRIRGLEVIPQHGVAHARIDFAVHSPRRVLAVEIDGRAWHHRTNAQLDADYLRERRLTAAGYSVVRFTAVETFRDPDKCWGQVLAIVDRSPLSDTN